jgi:uncharacterized repeat protein (TIGR04052 family)
MTNRASILSLVSLALAVSLAACSSSGSSTDAGGDGAAGSSPDGGGAGTGSDGGGDTNADRPADLAPSDASGDVALDGSSDGVTSDALDGGDGGATKKVTIQFKATVGTAAFACGTTYPAQGSASTTVHPLDFRFYVQDVRLIDAADHEVPLVLEDRAPWQTPDVALLDFEDGSGDCADGNAVMNKVVTGTVPAGTYKGIVFSNGVPAKLNHADPLTLPAPLQVGVMTWGWLYGFKFVKAELEATTAVGDAGAGVGLIHLGATGCDNAVDGGEPDFGGPPKTACTNQNRNEVRLTGFDPTSRAIIADIGAIFAETDLSKTSQCHSAGAACPSIFKALGVDLTTGAKLSTQTVYRPE